MLSLLSTLEQCTSDCDRMKKTLVSREDEGSATTRAHSRAWEPGEKIVEIQVRKIYCVNRAAPVLPISIEDAARSEAEIENALEHGEQLVRVNNSGHPVELQVYATVIDPKHAHTLVRKLNEILPLESLRHAKRDSSGMLSLLSTLEQSLKSGKKHALHATSVTNVCVGLLSGLKAILTLRSQPLEMEILNAVQGIFQSILAKGGICESQRRASSDGLELLARLGNDMFTVQAGKFGCCLWRCGDLLDDGDEVVVCITLSGGDRVKECGINLVYEDDEDLEDKDEMDEEKKDAHCMFNKISWTDRLLVEISDYVHRGKTYCFKVGGFNDVPDIGGISGRTGGAEEFHFNLVLQMHPAFQVRFEGFKVLRVGERFTMADNFINLID
ncbi:protein SWEETIE isoform X1 [Tanacetum coccineum]